jgi:hypothetical protein
MCVLYYSSDSNSQSTHEDNIFKLCSEDEDNDLLLKKTLSLPCLLNIKDLFAPIASHTTVLVYFKILLTVQSIA